MGLFAKAKARQEGWLLRRRAEQAWRMRWSHCLFSGTRCRRVMVGTSPVRPVPMGTRHSHTTWNGTSNTWVSRSEVGTFVVRWICM